MRASSVTVTLATIAVLMGPVAATTSSAEPSARSVDLALGDSLAASIQPNGDARSGYAEQVFQLEQARLPDLRLVKLGCPGERTSTFDKPKKRCPYDEGTQLAQAISVLETRDVAFVTLQIGSNDLFACFDFRRSTFDEGCVDDRLPKIATRLTSIVQTLQEAGPGVPIVGATYLDPVLALWTIPGFDQNVVMANADVNARLNDTLEQTYASLGVPVADIEGTFSSTDFETIVHVRGVGDLPINVARVCQWTYECSEKYDHDPHPNTIGYAAMTRAWEAALVTASPA
jgi:lysophospholipase L1-like esterase